MSLKDKMTKMFTYDDDPEEEEPEEKAPVAEEPSKNIFKYEKKAVKPVSSGIQEIAIVEPRTFDESFQIADKLKANVSVMVNLRKLSGADKQRVADILQGVTYGINGATHMTDKNSLLCTPASVSVDGDIIQEAQSQGDED